MWFLVEYYTPGGMEIKFAWIYVESMGSAFAREQVKKLPDFGEIIQVGEHSHVFALAGTEALVLPA